MDSHDELRALTCHCGRISCRHHEETGTHITEHERQMATKLERITKDPEGYYATARKAVYRDELRRALMPWQKKP